MTEIVGWLGSALVIALFLPQLVRTWRFGSDGGSLATPLMGAVCQATWCVYGVLRHDTVLIVCNAVSCCFAVAILARFALDARRRTHFSQSEADELLDTAEVAASLEA
ncbi:hypothetical protein Back2_12990 [Nocardioides baekrokdamisoli]|uniref:Sugar transporter SemiSWEET n=1 Tax=Nocardioides baekrokdamisoli TaxID=1804624 RepID=A0A3G9IFA3_9ACTN|nr:SemiSWEET family transporter [Nocardioides baekrokdamisoli]BBH17012.1 hypothetical protein Back2_12990 [Nocardioides baekrokdamisoli]